MDINNKIFTRNNGLFISKNGACLLETFNNGETIIPFKRESFIGLNEYLERLMRRFNMEVEKDNELLPPNCRFSFENKGGRVIVIEEPPSVRTIRVNIPMGVELSKLERQGKIDLYGYRDYLTKHPEGPWKATLSFPYIVYVISLLRENVGFSYNNLQAFFRISSLSSIGDSLLYPNLLNTNENCVMCIKGREADQDSPVSLATAEPLSNKVLGILERVWRYEYNLDYNFCNKLHDNVADVSSILEWEYNTKKDPMFIYSVNWLSYPFLLSEVINETLGRDSNDLRNESADRLYDNLKCSCVSDVKVGEGKLQKVTSYQTDEVDLSYIISSLEEAEEEVNNDEYDNNNNAILQENYYPSSRISVGDELLYKGKKVWINGFIFSERANKIETQILAENEKGEKEQIKLTKMIAKLFLKQITKKREEEVQTNGGKISAGDLILVTEPLPIVKRVIDVRISRDSEPEAHLQGGYYLLNHIKYEKIDEKDFTFGGTRFIKGHEYLIEGDRICVNPHISYGHRGKYKNLDNSNRIIFQKYGEENSEYKVSLNERINSISKSDLLISTDYAFFETSLLNGGENSFLINKDKKQMIVGTEKSHFGKKLVYGSPSFEDIFSRLFDGHTVTVPGIDRDISFSIGDKVIVADRLHPNRMKNISTITNIILEKENNIVKKLKFELTNSTEVFTQTFIDFSFGAILAGYIRKVVEEWNGIKVGMFFDPKSKVYGFLKNKRAVVSAIMVDTGCDIPMILCSNFNTVWATQNNLSLFEIGNTRRKSIETQFPIEYEKVQAYDNILVKEYNRPDKLDYFHGFANLNMRGINYIEAAVDLVVNPADLPVVDFSSRAERYISGCKYGILPPRKYFTRQYSGKKLIPNLFSWYYNDEDISKDIVSNENLDDETIERENR